MIINKDLMLYLKSSRIGEDEPDLGEKLMDSYLRMLLESGEIPSMIVCLNSAIFLTTEGSPVKEILEKFLSTGTMIFSCGTCLDYYNRRDKLILGQATDMIATVAAMLKYNKILAP